MARLRSTCLDFKLVNMFVIFMFLVCTSIFYGVYHVYSVLSNMNHMPLAFSALRAVIEQVPERLIVLDSKGNYNGQIVVDLSWDKEFTLISKSMLRSILCISPHVKAPSN